MEVNVRFKVSAAAVLFAATTGAADAAQPTCINPVGIWENAGKSTLIINKVDPSSHLAWGCYCSRSGTANEWFDLIGWVKDETPSPENDALHAVTWAFRWGPYGSITSWSGSCREPDHTPSMTTLWYLIEPKPEQVAAQQVVDTDTFRPTSATGCGEIPPKCQVK
jgi:hypothetical protein